MTNLKIEQLMKELEKRMGAYTKENLLQYDEASQLWYLRTFFSVYPDYSANVLVQSFVMELKKGMPQIEITVVLTNDVKEGTEAELEKAAGELNYISPAGAFGLRRELNRFYLRNCWPLDEKKQPEELADTVEIYYEMMMEAVQGGYFGLCKIWNGEMDYEQTVKEHLLNRAPV